MKHFTAMAFAFSLLFISFPIHAHETPIAVLQLKENQPGSFLVHWIFSSTRGVREPVPIFPEHCVYAPPMLECGDRGLAGVLSVEKLGEQYSGAIIRLTRHDGKMQSFTLTAAQPSITLVGDGAMAFAQVASAYIPLGFEHILLGVDHLLFVLGLIWLVRTPWMFFKTITAFTIAHSITLAVATLGWVGVPERPVNAAIALSIVLVAVEILKLRQGEAGLTVRYPWLVAFLFGLLHGFGFAGALMQLGLTQENIPAALLFFNVGVELGQLAFVFLILALQWSNRTVGARLPRWSEPVPAYAIGSLAMFWFISRFAVILPG